jgi:hypothetical protein
MLRYPIVTVTSDNQLVNQGAVDVETLSAQLVPIRDALLTLFDRSSAKGRGELRRLELGLTVTELGKVAFATGTPTPTLTMIIETRTPASSRSTPSRTSAAKKPDVVEID